MVTAGQGGGGDGDELRAGGSGDGSVHEYVGVSFRELKALLASLNWDASDEEVAKAEKELDKDLSGTIEFEEFLRCQLDGNA